MAEEDKVSPNLDANADDPEEVPVAVAATATADPISLPMHARSFAEFKLTAPLAQRCTDMGLSVPTIVQSACIPRIMEGMNVIANSPTGTGKTLSFALPMVNHWSKDPFGICGLVLTPTRELAQQIKEQFEALGGTSLRVCLVIGGADFQLQAMAMNKRPHFIVATPGRLADHIQTAGRPVNNLYTNLKFLVLDEADRLLGGDFDEQFGVITKALPGSQQLLLFTATVNESAEIVAESGPNKLFKYDYMVGRENQSLLRGQNLDQFYVLCPPDYKDGYLMELLRMIKEKEYPEPIRSMIIFAGTRKDCQILGLTLSELGFENVVIHADTEQKKRLQALSTFKSSQVMCLVGTDVVSRGLDIPQVDLVVNYTVPFPTDYIHRVGRAGRTSKKGTAISLITPRDIQFLKAVEAFVGDDLKELKIDESQVLKILTQVNATKRTAGLQVENNIYEERAKVNAKKRKILTNDSKEDGKDSKASVPTTDQQPSRPCPPTPKKKCVPGS